MGAVVVAMTDAKRQRLFCVIVAPIFWRTWHGWRAWGRGSRLDMARAYSISPRKNLKSVHHAAVHNDSIYYCNAQCAMRHFTSDNGATCQQESQE